MNGPVFITLFVFAALIWLANRSKNFYYILYELYQVVKYTWFILGFLLIGAFAFTQVDQAADVFNQVSHERDNWAELFITFFTFSWSFISWQSARIILFLTKQRSIKKAWNQRIQEWVPRLYALFPPLIMFLAFHGSDQYHPWNLGAALNLCLMLGFAVYFLVKYLWLRSPRETDRYTTHMHTWRYLFRYERLLMVSNTIFFGIAALFAFICFFPALIESIAFRINPVGILLIALCFWTFVFVLLTHWNHSTQLPIVLGIVACTIFVLSQNNIHLINILDDRKLAPNSRPGINTHMEQWLDGRLEHTPPGKSYPVFVIATEGGGIRSAYWTAVVLGELEKENPDFYTHVYAISSVSGGSLGASVYSALYADDSIGIKTSDTKALATARLNKVKGILSQDFLSSLNAALLFPELLQSFIPITYLHRDRACYLENAWSKAYMDSTGSSALDDAFLDLWKKNPKLPALFINSTKVESGEKAIVSNVVIDSTNFNAIDIQQAVGYHIPLKTAVLLSARFPFVTPPGTVVNINSEEKDSFNLVDGGYIDNSGLGTALTIANLLLKKKYADTAYKKMDVYVILIKNTEKPIQNNFKAQPVHAMSWGWDLKTPLNAFYNSWDNGFSDRILTTNYYFSALNAYSPQLTHRLIPFELNRKAYRMPLGWYLARGTCDSISSSYSQTSRTSSMCINGLLK